MLRGSTPSGGSHKRHVAVVVCAILFGGVASHGARAASLYDDLGGGDGIHAIVDRAVQHWLADTRIAPTFAETNMDRLRRLLAEQFCQLADGPCQYSGRDMAAAHRALGLNRLQFNVLAEDLQDAMDELGIGYHTQNRLIAKLAPMQRDVVTR